MMNQHAYPLDKAEVVDLLHDHGILPTQQRIDIALFLFQKPQHLSADEVLAGVNRRRERVSKATIYNTLGLFVSNGLVREVLIDPERVFYDSNTAAHHHVYNVDTGVLADVPAEAIQLETIPAIPAGTEFDSVDVIVRVRNTRRRGTGYDGP